MVRVWMPRAARTAAAGAFIFALSLTSLGGNAAASPSADEDGQRGCNALSHVRNDAVSSLREAWQGFRKQARDIAHDARELRKEKVDQAALAAAMTELKDANESLDGIRNNARDEMRAIFAATVCKVATAAAGNPMASQTVGPVDVAPLAAELAKKLKDVVDKAVKDMQLATDSLKATVAAMLNAAGIKAKTDDEDQDHKKARERAEKAKDALKRAEDVLKNGTLDGD